MPSRSSFNFFASHLEAVSWSKMTRVFVIRYAWPQIVGQCRYNLSHLLFLHPHNGVTNIVRRLLEEIYEIPNIKCLVQNKCSVSVSALSPTFPTLSAHTYLFRFLPPTGMSSCTLLDSSPHFAVSWTSPVCISCSAILISLLHPHLLQKPPGHLLSRKIAIPEFLLSLSFLPLYFHKILLRLLSSYNVILLADLPIFPNVPPLPESEMCLTHPWNPNPHLFPSKCWWYDWVNWPKGRINTIL